MNKIEKQRREILKKVGIVAAAGALLQSCIPPATPIRNTKDDKKPGVSQNLNVKSFGAVGDGSHDDTQGVQNAIKEAAQNRMGVFIPSGVYIISKTITIEANCSFIVGDGMGSNIRRKTLLKFTGLGACLELTKNANFVSIENISIISEGNKKKTTGVLFDCTKIQFHNILIAGFGLGIGKISKGTVYDIQLNNLEITNCNTGIKTINTNNLTISSCLISSCDIGVDLEGGANLVINNGTVIQIFGNKSNVFRSGESQNSRSISIKNTLNFVCQNCYFENGSLSNIPTNQKIASVENARGLIFSQNYCVGSAGENAKISPITLKGANHSVKIESNVFHRFPNNIVLISGPNYSSERGDINQFSYCVSNNTTKKSTKDFARTFELSFFDEGTSRSVTYKKNIAYCHYDGVYAHVKGVIELESCPSNLLSRPAIIGPFPLSQNSNDFIEEIFANIVVQGNPKQNIQGVLRRGRRALELRSDSSARVTCKSILKKRIHFSISYPFRSIT